MPTNIAMPVITKNEKVTKHIKFAADKTGVDFDYLLQTAKRESALNINAKAKTSSATGLFQFIRQTWYETLHDFGPKHGYAELSSQIKRDSSGRYFVPNQKAKSAILNLRKDPKAASLMAAEFSKQNINYLKGKIGRQPVASELYMAHFMGRGSAAKLIQLNERAPEVKANELFPKQAAANKAIFFNKGKARSIGQVYDNLSKYHVQISKEKGLNPNSLESVAKLVPFLPGNDGFFGNLFGKQSKSNENTKPFAYTGIGDDAKPAALNSLLFTQLEGQQNSDQKQQPQPLPQYPPTIRDKGSIAQGTNIFSLTPQ